MTNNIFNKLRKLGLVTTILLIQYGCVEHDNSNSDLTSEGMVNESFWLDVNTSDYLITVPNNLAWKITSSPEWATPYEYQGVAGDKISLFVEDLGDEGERSDTLVVNCDNGTIVKYLLIQNASEPPYTSGRNIEQQGDIVSTYGVAFGIDVFQKSNVSKYYIVSTPFNKAKLLSALKENKMTDAFYEEDVFNSKMESYTGTSTTSIANQLSVAAGVEVGMSGFNAKVSGSFSQSSESNKHRAYAMQKIQHIVGTRYILPGMLRYYADGEYGVFQTTFQDAIDSLKKNPNDETVFKKILNKYGTHIITYGTLGGELELAMEMVSETKISETDIHAALDLSVKVVNADGEFNMDNKQQEMAKNTTIHLTTYGGKNAFTLGPNTTIETLAKDVMNKENLEKWVKTIKSKESLQLIDIQTIPIYELVPEAARDNFRRYIVQKYQKSFDSNNVSQLFAIKGFGWDFPYEKAIEIPEIDTKLMFKCGIVEELSETELSAMVYSGTGDAINYDCGFFIGSKTRKPGILRKKNGAYKLEEFDALDTQPIQEIYVDALGDVTIFPKTVADFYDVKELNIEGVKFGVGVDKYEGTDTPPSIQIDDILVTNSDNLTVINEDFSEVDNRWSWTTDNVPPIEEGALKLQLTDSGYQGIHSNLICSSDYTVTAKVKFFDNGYSQSNYTFSFLFNYIDDKNYCRMTITRIGGLYEVSKIARYVDGEVSEETPVISSAKIDKDADSYKLQIDVKKNKVTCAFGDASSELELK